MNWGGHGDGIDGKSCCGNSMGGNDVNITQVWTSQKMAK